MISHGCGGANTVTPNDTATASTEPSLSSAADAAPEPAVEAWKCPPADKLIRLVLVENPTATMTEGAEAEVDHIDPENGEAFETFWVKFYDLNGDGALAHDLGRLHAPRLLGSR